MRRELTDEEAPLPNCRVSRMPVAFLRFARSTDQAVEFFSNLWRRGIPIMGVPSGTDAEFALSAWRRW